MTDPDVEQDKNFWLPALNAYKANLDNESNNVYSKLAVVRNAFKEAKGTVEVENAPRVGAVTIGNTRLVLKPLDSLKQVNKLTYLANIFEFNIWREETEAWSLSRTSQWQIRLFRSNFSDW